MILWLLEHVPNFIPHLMVVGGAIGLIISKLIPLPQIDAELKLIAILVLSFGLFMEGATFSADQFKTETAAAQAEVKRINDRGPIISHEIQVQYVTQEKIIKEKGDEVIKYINVAADNDCKLHDSTIRVLDGAAKNEVPGTPKGTDDPTAGVALSTVTETVSKNYTTYNQVAEELKKLQEWVRSEYKNMNGKDLE